jgi:uncharacterized membrane-anchored protein YjiN (DUF445 family)
LVWRFFDLNQYKATIILIIVSIGVLITYPFHKYFLGGLLSSGFTASMIGGFADWFGVTALFRKPLGVSFRTEIIPKNREKIFSALSDMVGQELLTKETLKKLLNNHSIAALLIKFLLEKNEKEAIKKIVHKIIEDILYKIDSKEVGQVAGKLVKDNIAKLELFYFIEAAVKISKKNGYDDKLINFIIEELIKLAKYEQIKALIVELVKETIKNYENGSKRRMFTNKIVFDMILRISPEDISRITQGKLIDYLKELKDYEHPMRYKLNEWIDEKLHELKEDTKIQEKLENWKLQQINEKLDISKFVVDFISKYKSVEQSKEFLQLINTVDEQLDKFIDTFEKNHIWQDKFDAYSKQAMLEFVEKNHSKIAVLVRENLDKYSNDMLVELIESKAGDDLQMIRINGSVVGGLVGLLIYILTFWIG